MHQIALRRRLLAEFLGTALLVTAVVGAGIMATTLSPGDVGLQLLKNSVATAFALAAPILMFGPVSGAHFNPLVSAADWLLGRRAGTGLPGSDLVVYILAQIGAPAAVGAYIGAAYWFTSSTSFANPAVTIGRTFTDTFAGISPASVPGFVIAQLVGLAIGTGLLAALYPHAVEPDAVVTSAR